MPVRANSTVAQAPAFSLCCRVRQPIHGAGRRVEQAEARFKGRHDAFIVALDKDERIERLQGRMGRQLLRRPIDSLHADARMSVHQSA